MKRFTESGKWSDPWFRKLSPVAKLLWMFLCDNCDQAGVIDLDRETAAFQMGAEFGDTHLKEFGNRIETLSGGKIWICKFIDFQHGTPSLDCKAHKPIFASLKKHGLERVLKGYPKGMDTPPEGGPGTGTGTGKGTGTGNTAHEGVDIPTGDEWRAEFHRYDMPPEYADYHFAKLDVKRWKGVLDWRAKVREIKTWWLRGDMEEWRARPMTKPRKVGAAKLTLEQEALKAAGQPYEDIYNLPK